MHFCFVFIFLNQSSVSVALHFIFTSWFSMCWIHIFKLLVPVSEYHTSSTGTTAQLWFRPFFFWPPGGAVEQLYSSCLISPCKTKLEAERAEWIYLEKIFIKHVSEKCYFVINHTNWHVFKNLLCTLSTPRWTVMYKVIKIFC